MTLYRLRGDEDPEKDTSDKPDPAYLEYLLLRRDALIMELRGLDKILITYGKLSRETLPRRVR